MRGHHSDGTTPAPWQLRAAALMTLAALAAFMPLQVYYAQVDLSRGLLPAYLLQLVLAALVAAATYTRLGTRYAERLTIGKKEILEKAPRDVIRRFYRDWYRPNLMAVIAVGDSRDDALARAREHVQQRVHQHPERLW